MEADGSNEAEPAAAYFGPGKQGKVGSLCSLSPELILDSWAAVSGIGLARLGRLKSPSRPPWRAGFNPSDNLGSRRSGWKRCNWFRRNGALVDKPELDELARRSETLLEKLAETTFP